MPGFKLVTEPSIPSSEIRLTVALGIEGTLLVLDTRTNWPDFRFSIGQRTENAHRKYIIFLGGTKFQDPGKK